MSSDNNSAISEPIERENMIVLFSMAVLSGFAAFMAIPVQIYSDHWFAAVKYRLHRCDYPGCWKPGSDCYYPDNYDYSEPDVYACWEHQDRMGFCHGCGLFWGGVESFEFIHPGWCDNCHSDPDYGWRQDYEDEEYESGYFDDDIDWIEWEPDFDDKEVYESIYGPDVPEYNGIIPDPNGPTLEDLS